MLPAAVPDWIRDWRFAFALWAGERTLASPLSIRVTCLVPRPRPLRSCITLTAFDVAAKNMDGSMDTLGIEPRTSRMLSGCDTTTPRALLKIFGVLHQR